MSKTYNFRAECAQCGLKQDFDGDSDAELKESISSAGWLPRASAVAAPAGGALLDWNCPACEARDPKIDHFDDEAIARYSYREQATLVIDATLRRLKLAQEQTESDEEKIERVSARSRDVGTTLAIFTQWCHRLASLSSAERTEALIMKHHAARQSHADAVTQWEVQQDDATIAESD